MSNGQRYSEGFATGWASILGPRILHDIPASPSKVAGSDYFIGLMDGITAAKTQKADLLPVEETAAAE